MIMLVAKSGTDKLDFSASHDRSGKVREKKQISRLPFFNSILYTGLTSFHEVYIYLSLSVHELSLLLFSKDH